MASSKEYLEFIIGQDSFLLTEHRGCVRLGMAASFSRCVLPNDRQFVLGGYLRICRRRFGERMMEASVKQTHTHTKSAYMQPKYACKI